MKYRIHWRNVVTGDEGFSQRGLPLAEAAPLCEVKNQSTEYEHWIEPMPHLEQKGWIHEDELPPNYPYDQMFPESKVFCGVRIFPKATA